MKKTDSMQPNRVRNPSAGDLGKPPLRQATRPKAKTAASAPAIPRTGPSALLEAPSRNGELQTVTIDYFSRSARAVFVTGTFNDWQLSATPMTQERDGRWTVSIHLKPGRYEYRIVTDGRCVDDPMAASFAANPSGGFNSVLLVVSAAMCLRSASVATSWRS